MSWAVVTGASAGIGCELAHSFAKAGHSVVLIARRERQLQDLVKDLKSKYPNISAEMITEDLSSVGAAQRIVDELTRRQIETEFLVNNAGFGSSGAFNELPLERELQMIDLNIRVLVELTGLLLPAMVARKSGKILNVGSTAGFQPGPFMATYYASKAFVNSFSEALSEELRGTGISVTVLAPGPVTTEFWAVANAGNAGKFQPFSATAKEVAQYGFDSLMRGKVMAVFGAKFKFLVQANRITPRAIVRKVVGRINRTAAT